MERKGAVAVEHMNGISMKKAEENVKSVSIYTLTSPAEPGEGGAGICSEGK